MNILGGVHQAPLYCSLCELPPLMPVVAELLLGEDGTLCGSS